MRTVVVLAGGLGSRVAHLTGAGQPKALLPVAGHAFIDVKLAQLATAGAHVAILLTGHGRNVLEGHLRGLRIRDLEIAWYDDGPELLGTGGAIAAVREHLPETFWITYGDTLVDAPMADVEATLGDGQDGVMTVLENRDRWARSNVAVDDDLVVRYDKDAGSGALEWIDYGLLVMRQAAFEGFTAGSAFDLMQPIQAAVARRRLGAFAVTERFHDIGTERSWRETDEWAQRSRLLERIGLA
ncbi:MAG TPA: NTP transferase domain-containing protein [Acidimicrobiia bacterium]